MTMLQVTVLEVPQLHLPRGAHARRLMRFDLDVLYELHYQMITLGKVSRLLHSHGA